MTKVEYEKCEKLMEEAIIKIEQANEEFKAYSQLLFENILKAETEQRKADQHYGYAEGIYQALSVIGFKHEDMKKLANLI